jgi:nucleoside-diphosphate-sugar epimerase
LVELPNQLNMSSNTPILITGGTGFAGSHLVEALLATGETNLHVTNFGNKPSFVTNLLPADQIHSLDLTQGEAVTDLIKLLKPAQIYHLAATATVGNSFSQAQKVIDDHSRLQLNLLEAIQAHDLKARVLPLVAQQSMIQLRFTTSSYRRKLSIGPVSLCSQNSSDTFSLSCCQNPSSGYCQTI